MQHECPIHPTSMVKWRQRVGVEKLESLLAEVIDEELEMFFGRANQLLSSEETVRRRKTNFLSFEQSNQLKGIAIIMVVLVVLMDATV